MLAFAPLGLSLGEIAGAGAQRVSVGGGLTWTAANAEIEAAERLLDGDFSALGFPDKRVEGWLSA